MSQSIFRAAFFVCGICIVARPAITAADEPDQAKTASVDAETAKQNVLAWIDDYREKQVLFHDEDIARLRKELADDSPEEAIQWWTKTARIRAALESPQWQETSKWLREFLRVQAIFSDQQIDELRTKAKDAAEQDNTREFKELLAQIERYRGSLVQGAADDRAIREHKLQILNAYKQESAAQRDNVAKAAAFGTTSPRQAAVPRQPRYPAAPLINSLDVARWSVMRNFWRY